MGRRFALFESVGILYSSRATNNLHGFETRQIHAISPDSITCLDFDCFRMRRAAKYPQHLAKYVAARLPQGAPNAPSEQILTALFETLYFASLKTDEGRPCRFIVNYLDPADPNVAPQTNGGGDQWTCVPFDQPLPCDIRTLVKLSEAIDPTASSLAVYSDGNGHLFIWGIVDQELRYADYAALDSATIPDRPGLFQAVINGVGNISVYNNYSLICSLEHNALVEQYHNVVWSGPIHDMLASQIWATFEQLAGRKLSAAMADHPELKAELLTRWMNAVCRILLNIQKYRHGGGLLVVPDSAPMGTNVKYKLRYDRLPRSLVAMAQYQVSRLRLSRKVAEHCRDLQLDNVPCRLHLDLVDQRKKLEAHKNAVLGCVRFIAGLSRVDGFIMLDRSLVVNGFGVELRADSPLNEVLLAGDAQAQRRLMQTANLEEYGTRHRAMMRYCYETSGALGFVVSQDGDIRAMTRIGEHLVLWDNINVQLAFKVEHLIPTPHFPSIPAAQPVEEAA